MTLTSYQVAKFSVHFFRLVSSSSFPVLIWSLFAFHFHFHRHGHSIDGDVVKPFSPAQHCSQPLASHFVLRYHFLSANMHYNINGYSLSTCVDRTSSSSTYRGYSGCCLGRRFVNLLDFDVSSMVRMEKGATKAANPRGESRTPLRNRNKRSGVWTERRRHQQK